MGDNAAMNLSGNDRAEAAAEREIPQVFVRTFVVPPGAPWTQSRMAGLEVRHGAPLPLADVMHRLRRQGGWSPGQAGRYAAFYIRRADYRAPFETVVSVDGEALKVGFGRQTVDVAKLKRVAVLSALGAATLALVAYALATAFAARSEADARLESLERQGAARLRVARELESQRATRRALAHARGESGAPADVLADIGWAASARTPDSQILAVHWDHGLMAIESRGEAPPIIGSDRDIVRAPHPLRPGVWLWGVRRKSLPGQAGEPAP